MKETTYEKIENYYIFSNKPNTRVYLGEANPEDYLWDQQEQEKRTASCGYFNLKTGERAEEPEEWEEEFYDTHEYECTYDFNRRVPVASLGGSDKNCEYVSSEQKYAWSWYFGQTVEQYEEDRKKFDQKMEEKKRLKPSLHNLMMVDGETYYVNDAGDRITFDEHVALMKQQLGEDCFEKERENLDPKAKEFGEKVANFLNEMKGMNREQKLEYIKSNQEKLASISSLIGD